MRKYVVFLFTFYFLSTATASHITGGEMSYVFNGIVNGDYSYSVTLKLLMRCNSGRQFNDPAIIGVFNKLSNARIKDISVPLSRRETIQLGSFSKCISDPPTVCYEVGYYQFGVLLPPSPDGYLLSGQFTYRIAGINNLITSNSIGATYTAEIPGTLVVPEGAKNTSALFVGNDLVVVCAGNFFSYSFAATDADGDRLQYSFCSAYQGGTGGGNTNPPPSAPPYQPVPYSFIYNGSVPLGTRVQIDANTGLLTGIAPADAGIYVVTVCVAEIRNGAVIAVQRKDIQLNIAPCTIVGAKLQPEYMLCGTTKTLSLKNLSVSPLIVSQEWEFLDSRGIRLYLSTDEIATFTFADTGTYTIKLVVNRAKECSDSTVSLARVYPGFVPDFTSKGLCFKKPTQFTDATTAGYGSVTSWKWVFAEDDITDGTSVLQNPSYTYATVGLKAVRMIASNSVGCVDTVYKNITVFDKPPITLAFRDTLVCVGDVLVLKATGNGIFSWRPAENMQYPGTSEPVVNPLQTTTYFVNLNDDGCLNNDSVNVRVTDHVNLQPMADTTVCQFDSTQLKIVSDGFKYTWTPASLVVNPAAKNATVVTPATTVYSVTASIGGCSATADVLVKAVAYPLADAGRDTTICFNSAAYLHAVSNGATYNWSPTALVSNAGMLNPIAKPPNSTAYIFYAYDTKGCPKPGIDTVLVRVLPKIQASAGNDTAVIVGQPLQFAASGGLQYQWSPPIGLSAVNKPDPIAVYNEPSNGIRYSVLVYNSAGCVDSAFIGVKVFKSLPDVFVPSAFSPNRDNRNDLLRPIGVGIRQIKNFSVYNRWGQLVFSSDKNGDGWNGVLFGKVQDPGVFVWMVQATDYLGRPFHKKGSVLLVR